MIDDIPLSCTCGELRAVIQNASPKTTNRNVCCCESCQRYARALGKDESMLDDNGGTDVFQVCPASFEFVAGREHLGCIQQTPKGALRWYATCCNSAIANTLPTRGVPFVAVHTTFVDEEALPKPIAEFVGQIRATVNSSTPLASQHRATTGALLAMLPHVAVLTLKWRLSGDYKRSPFFDAETGVPVLAPIQAPSGNRD